MTEPNTTEKKAKEIYDKMFQGQSIALSNPIRSDYAKECALICVDEKEKELTLIHDRFITMGWLAQAGVVYSRIQEMQHQRTLIEAI